MKKFSKTSLLATIVVAAFVLTAGLGFAAGWNSQSADWLSGGHGYMNYPYAGSWNAGIDGSSYSMWIPDWNNYDSGYPYIWGWEGSDIAYYPLGYPYYSGKYWGQPNDRFGRRALIGQDISSRTQQSRVNAMLNGSTYIDSSGAYIL